MSFDLKGNAPLIIAGIAIIAAIYFATNAPQNGSVGYAVLPGQDTSAQQAQINSLNAQSAANYNQQIFGAFSALTSLGAAEYNDQTQVTLQNSKASAQNFQILEQANVANNQANDQLAAQQAAQHTSQQSSFWGDLFGGISTIAKLVPLSAATYTATSNTLPAIGSVGANTASVSYG
jgi:hypothetical protein